MALDGNDFALIVEAITQCVYIKEEQRAYELLAAKINELAQVKFDSNVGIQKSYIKQISRLKRAKTKLELKIKNYDATVQFSWLKLISILDDRLNKLSRLKQLHAAIL